MSDADIQELRKAADMQGLSQEFEELLRDAKRWRAFAAPVGTLDGTLTIRCTLREKQQLFDVTQVFGSWELQHSISDPLDRYASEAYKHLRAAADKALPIRK